MRVQPRGADLLAQALARGNTRNTFALSGNHIMPIFDAAQDCGIFVLSTFGHQACGLAPVATAASATRSWRRRRRRPARSAGRRLARGSIALLGGPETPLAGLPRQRRPGSRRPYRSKATGESGSSVGAAGAARPGTVPPVQSAEEAPCPRSKDSQRWALPSPRRVSEVGLFPGSCAAGPRPMPPPSRSESSQGEN